MATKTISVSSKTSVTVTYTINSSETAITFDVTNATWKHTSGLPEDTCTVISIYKGSSICGQMAWIPPKGSKTWGGNIAMTPQSHTRTHSTSSATYTIKIDFQTLGSSNTHKALSTNIVVSIPAKPSYKVTYNANGGSGAPASQTKWYNENLTLTSAKPTRTGYTFKGWATSASSTTTIAYTTYSTNANLSLYAVWQINTYTITYNGNGATSGSVAAQTKTYNSNLTLRPNNFIRTDYQFFGWNTSFDGNGTSYSNEGTYTANAAATLYAQWNKIYSPPELTIKNTYRADDDGIPDDEGTYLVIEADYSVYTLNGNNPFSWVARCNNKTQSQAAEGGTASSGFAKFIINAELDTDKSYTATLTLTDTQGGSENRSSGTVSKTTSIGTAFYIMDVLKGGHGIAFGQSAKNQGFVVNMPNIQINEEGTITHKNDIPWTILPLNTGTIAAYNDRFIPKYRKWGQIISLHGTVKPTSEIGVGNNLTIGTLPVGYRPLDEECILCQGSGEAIWTLKISTEGVITASLYRDRAGYKAISTTTVLPFHITFLI